MKQQVRIQTIGVAGDYTASLVPRIIQSLGYQIVWAIENVSDLTIMGPFADSSEKKYRWAPKPLRPVVSALLGHLARQDKPLTLFQTGESIRHDALPHDYAISFDLSVRDVNHFRMPYWWEMIDWSASGITGNTNPRFGRLLNLHELMQPLGERFMERPKRVAIFASHMREPRATLMQAVSALIPVDGYGPAFNRQIQNHHWSGIEKVAILQNYGFNLCPENNMYPGYYTEKIPEAFAAGCLPLGWTDTNVLVDFNPEAFVNLASMMSSDFRELSSVLLSDVSLRGFADQPLLLSRPDIEPLIEFIRRMLADALS